MTTTRAFAIGGWGLAVLGAVGTVLVRIAAPAPLLPKVFGFGPAAMVRAHYDAARMVSELSAGLRDDVEIGRRQDDIVGIVHRSVAPTGVGLRLRPGAAR